MGEQFVHNPEYKVEVRNLTKNFGDLKVLLGPACLDA